MAALFCRISCPTSRRTVCQVCQHNHATFSCPKVREQFCQINCLQLNVCLFSLRDSVSDDGESQASRAVDRKRAGKHGSFRWRQCQVRQIVYPKKMERRGDVELGC